MRFLPLAILVVARVAFADTSASAPRPAWVEHCRAALERVQREMARRSSLFANAPVRIAHADGKPDDRWMVSLQLDLGRGSLYLALVHDGEDPAWGGGGWTRDMAYDESGEPARWRYRGALAGVVAMPWRIRDGTFAFDRLSRRAIERCMR